MTLSNHFDNPLFENSKRAGFITIAIISMFFAACGGDSTSNKNRDGNKYNPPAINLSMASSVKAYVGESKTIPVTVQGDTSFTVSVDKSGSGCEKSGNNIVCKPAASGTYAVTATATADAAKKVTATLTVPEIEVMGGNNQTLYADDTESSIITFNAAGNWTAMASDGDGGIPAWLSLDVVSGLSVDDSDIQLYEEDYIQLYSGDDYEDAEVSINAVNVSGGSGNNFISVTLQPNDSLADRTATITITTSTGQITITITQRFIKRDGTPLTPEDVSISISPATASITVGTSRTFTVTRANTADFTLSAPSAAGCAKSGVNVVACTPTTAGIYTVTVTATADATKNASATLTVTTANQSPVITSQPVNQTVTAGQNATFSVTANGTPAPTFQWQVSTNSGSTWSNVSSGGTGATLTLTSVTAAMNNYRYRVSVTNSAGSVTSNSATLTVPNQAPVITSHPVNQTVTAGQNATFSVTATGTPAQTYQWQVSTNSGSTWSNVSGATGVTLTLTSITSAMNNNLYHVVVANSAGSVTSITAKLTVSQDPVPIITSHPVNQTVTAGQNATFSVTATGTPAPTYQWQVSTNSGSTWSNVSSATGATLTLTSVTSAMNNNLYHVVVTNSAGSVTSNSATLTVNQTPVITSQPVNQTVTSGQNATFSVTATSTPAPTYQWQVSTNSGSTWSNVSSATGATLTLTSVTSAMNNNRYRVTVTNSAGSVTSNSATLTVNQAPVITSQPVNRTVTAGQNATFSVTATGTPAPTYQWQVSTNNGSTWSNVSSGGTGATLTLTSVTTAMNNYRYRVTVANTAGSVTSNSATLTVDPVIIQTPVITSHPVNQTIAAGQNATFSVTATGTPVLTYQWQVSTNNGSTWSNVSSGGTGATLTLTSVTSAMNNYRYRVTVANAAGSVTSNSATLTVLPAIQTVYLENDILSTSSSNVTKYPASGSFVMAGTTYSNGIKNASTFSDSDGTATYRFGIGQEFKRLKGTFGKVAGTGAGWLTVTSGGAGNERLLGGYVLNTGSTSMNIDITIPSGVQIVNIRLQRSSYSTELGFGNAYFSTDAQNLTPLQPPDISGAVYLENYGDISSGTSSLIAKYPANGSFVMEGAHYFRGIKNTSSYSDSDGTATYNISGQGFRRLKGTFGRVTGTGSGWLTVTSGGTGNERLLGGYVLNTGSTSMNIDITIPSDVQIVNIRLQRSSYSTELGFGDAYFSTDGQYLTPLQPPDISGAFYLENYGDISSGTSSLLTKYPANGSFVMEGTHYFRGIKNTSSYSDSDGTATYNISGQGFRRLIGTLSRAAGTGAGEFVVIADGTQLGTFSLSTSETYK